MMRGKCIPLQRRIFSIISSVILILSTLLIGISIQEPNASAGSVYHTVGNLDIKMLMDYGRILSPLDRNGVQTVQDTTTLGFIGLVIDHDNYDHTPGAEDIADCFNPSSPLSPDDFRAINTISMIINDGTTQKSFGSFQNKGAGTGYPDDILINQTCWTVLNKDWAILQWNLVNVKSPASTLTNVRVGLEVAISKVGGRYGLGGELDDGGDDVDGYDGTNDVYWAQDKSDDTTIGFASAITSDPITHYFAEDYHVDYSTQYVNLFNDDTWLYQRITAPSQPATDGVNPENITATVGWDGFDILAGESRTVTLVIAINDTYNSMITAIKDAQYYYKNEATYFLLTEFSNDQTGTQQVEIYSNGCEETDLLSENYKISVNGGSTFLSGSWVPQNIPTYGYSVFQVTGSPILAEGGSIGLYQDFGGGNVVLLDGPFSYGQQGIVPDPLDGESVARRFDTGAASYLNEWLHDSTSTWGDKNDVGSIISTQIVLNRVMFNPLDPVESYVELMYTGSAASVPISNYKIVCDGRYTVLGGNNLGTTDRFFVLPQSNFPVGFDLDDGSSNGDNVYLYDDNNNLIDMVGWSSAHTQGYFMSRIPDGSGTKQGYNDATSQTASWAFDQLPSMMITEFYVDSGSATIEVYNPRGGEKVLNAVPARWTLESTVDGGGALAGNWAPTTIPADRGYSIFTMSAGTPGNEGDTISLFFNPGTGNILMDEVSFGTYGVAPDPLSGESTARYWDVSLSVYSNDWTRNASSGPTWNAQNDVSSIEPFPFIILNEVMFNPGIIPDGRYIVIINNQGFDIDISNYCLVCDDYYKLPPMLLPSFTMLLIEYLNAPLLFNTMDLTGDNVYLYDNNGRLLDMVGWNSPHTQGFSVRRVPDGFGTYQGYDDVSSVAAGWVFNSPLQVIITEISDDGSLQAQIEVFNPWYSTVDFSTDFTFESDSTPPGPISGGWWIPVAGPDGYAVFNVTAGLNPQGDTISFYQKNILIEQISYGLKGTVPDPLPDESVERYWDGSRYINLWERNWTSGPNFGAQNDVPPGNLSSPIKLNEVLFNPNVLDEYFVEIYNLGTTPIDISGYKLVCNTEYIIPDGIFIDFDNFFYLLYGTNNEFFDNMLSSGDNVYLYNKNGSLVDMVGWSSSHTVGMTVCRIPDGNGTRDGYDDVSSVIACWRFDRIPTISLIQIDPDTQNYAEENENVTYYLNIFNKHSEDHLLDISNITGPWGWEVITQDAFGNPLNDTNGNGIPDIFVPAWARTFIIVVVKVPIGVSPGDNETTIITAQSASNPFFIDNATLITRIKTIHTATFPIGSFVIPMDDKQSDVLKAFGFVHALLRNGSTIYRIIEPPDIVIYTLLYPLNEIFAGGPILVMPSNASIVNMVHPDFSSVTLDTTIAEFTSDRVDVIFKPTNILVIYGTWGHTQDVLSDMGIPYTMVYTWDVENDPNMLFNYDLIVDDCPGWGGNVPSAIARNMQSIAEKGGEIIFTDIALRDMDAVFPGHIPVTSNVAGTWPCSVYRVPEFPGQYYGPSTLGIYTMSAGQVMMAPTDPNVRIMVDCDNYGGNYRVLAAYFYYGSGGYTGGVVEGFGYHPGDQPPDARILASIFFGNKFVHLPPEPVTIDIEPPDLFITAVGDDIILNWTQHSTEGLSHYLIYRSTSQTGFDFSNVWVDTSLHNDSGIIPLRTTWNDTGAASGNASQEYYYVIRTVFITGEISSTSRTVGKWTRTFPKGISTFSLPLEPLNNLTIDNCLNDMKARYLKWMHPGSRKWMQHGDGVANDTQMKLGEGYEVNFDSQARYTFTGMPGAMIIYDDNLQFLGFDYATEAKNLTVRIEPNGDVNLTWQEPSDMNIGDWYDVFYSHTRDGFFRKLGIDYFLVCPAVLFGTNTAIHLNALANDPGTRLYYMVVPVNTSLIRGAGTYSIGIWTEEFLSQYDTIGIPLKLSAYQTADWYCDNIPDTVGINYYDIATQRWCWHSTRMPAGAFDPVLEMTVGYQISTSSATKFIFIGV